MINTIKPLLGQSNYDLALKSIGSLDGFIKMLNDNQSFSSSLVPNLIIYDTNNIIAKLITGYNYSTGYNSGLGYLTDNGTILTDNGTPLTDN